MGFLIPTAFAVIGSDEDALGAEQYSAGKAIGGGAVADGHDEMSTALKNARYLWASGNLACFCNLWSKGRPSTPTELLLSFPTYMGRIAEVDPASYPSGRYVLEIPADGALKRGNIIVECDVESCYVTVEYWDTGGLLLGTHNTGIPGGRGFVTASIGLPAPEDLHYIMVRVVPTSAQIGRIWGIRIMETEGSL